MANILPDGGRGTSVNPFGSNYPFVDPSADVRHILADAYLAHEDRTVALPLRFSRLRGFDAAFLGAEARCDVEVRDAADTLIFNSAAAVRYRSAAFGPRLKIHEWYADYVVLRVVQHTAFPDAESVVAVPADFAPVDGRLDERVVVLLPRRVRAVRDAATSASAMKDIVFANGYNVTMETRAVSRGLRAAQQIIWAAEPASGLGRYPGCVAPDLVIRTINKMRPDGDGDFRLDARDCYWVRQPTTLTETGLRTSVPVPAMLHLGNDCGPCCECDDFVRVQRGILRTWGEFVAAAGVAGSTRDVFRQIIARWEQERGCVEAKVVTLTLAPYGGQYVEVLATVCNHTRFCLRDTTLALMVETSPGPGSVPSGSTTISTPAGNRVPYTLGGNWPGYVAYFDAIQAMANGSLRTRLYVPAAQPGQVITVRAAASTAAPLPGLRLPQQVTATATFGS